MARAVTFAIHLPLLRLSEGRGVSGGDFELWRMPFDVFDELSMGAFGDHRAAYEATGPVFLRLDVPLPDDTAWLQPVEAGRKTVEIKIDGVNWEEDARARGFGLLAAIHSGLVDRFSAALALVAPASLLPRARHSLSFMQAAPGLSLVGLLDEPVALVRVQGDTDLEYLFAHDCVGAPLPPAVVAEAIRLMPVLPRADREPELATALRYLCDAGEPSLRPSDQALLCLQACEALMLPEARSGLAERFAACAAPLVDGDRSLARRLYEIRSASLHGQDQPEGAADAVESARPARLLAAALLSALRARSQGVSLAEWREGLPAQPATTPPAPVGLAQPERVAPPVRHHPVTVRTSVHGSCGPPGHLLAIVPLVGLGLGYDERHSLGWGLIAKGINSSNVVALEDKDIARDFISNLHQCPRDLASLQYGRRLEDEVPGTESLWSLHLPRSMGVCSLRLAGYDAFVDPALVGLHALIEQRRLCEPSVLRQTALLQLRQEPSQTLDLEGVGRVRRMLDLLYTYREAGGHPDAERWIQAYRRLHYAGFLPDTTRLALGFALIEGLLGRFRNPADGDAPERLAVQADGEAGAWYAAEGRTLRNALAHGRLSDTAASVPTALAALARLGRSALPLALQVWLTHHDRLARPSRLLRTTLRHEADQQQT